MNDQENAATPRSFHLFNCDNTYDLDSVEKLIKTVAGDVQVRKTYFPLPSMTLLSQELEGNTMDCAVFVVHAHESRLSINEPRAGIGYAKIYRALLNATGKKAIILMCDDDCLDDDSVISPRVEQMLNRHRGLIPQLGNKLLVMSYNKRPSKLHEDYVTKTLCGHEIQLELDLGHATRQSREDDKRSGRLQGIGAGQGGAGQGEAARHELGVHGEGKTEYASDGFYEGGRQHYYGQHGKEEEDRRGQAFGGRQGEKGLGENKPDEANEMKMCYQAILLNENQVLIVIGGDDNYKTQEERDTSVLSQWARGKVSSQFLEEYMNGSRSFIFSWDEHHHPIHEEALQHFLDPGKTDEFVPKPRPPQVSVPDPIAEPDVVDSKIKDIKFTPDPDPVELLFQPTPHMPTQTATEPIRNLQPTFVPTLVNFEGFEVVDMKSENAPNLQVLSFCHNKEAAENLYQFLEKVYQQLAVNDRPPQPPTLDDYSQVPSFLEKNKPDYVVVVLETNEVLKSLDGKEEEVEETRALLDKLAECVQYHIGKKAIILMCDDDCLDDDSMMSPRVEQMLNRHRGLISQLENKLLVMSYNKRPSKLHEYYVTETLCGHEIQKSRQSREDDKRSGRLQGIGAGQGGAGQGGAGQGEAARHELGVHGKGKTEYASHGFYEGGRQHYDGQHGKEEEDRRGQAFGGRQGEKGLGENKPDEADEMKMCYQAILLNGHVSKVIYRSSDFTFPDHVKEEYREDYSRVRKATLEAYKDANGHVKYIVPHYNESNGHLLHYRATMEYGSINSASYCYPPGYKPPKYMLDDMIIRNDHHFSATLEIWEDKRGQLYPTVEVGSSPTCGRNKCVIV
ncbi:predicted protein [Nematostella vectensis]|uniref:Uncharacterized protein n=1 Tax=Nematostella vectensis TaxID=45351 RepID=A7T4H0_NEMVE|nr:predicted protein [Nematostella vectensis]|eukprot:XP_001621242.1 hypothetical protein NEMVEDRAFT_v1g222210 [Nematostella vectensis]